MTVKGHDSLHALSKVKRLVIKMPHLSKLWRACSIQVEQKLLNGHYLAEVWRLTRNTTSKVNHTEQI